MSVDIRFQPEGRNGLVAEGTYLLDAAKRLGVRKDFRDLPLKRKVTTLVELEAVTLFQTLNAIIDVPFAIGGKVLDLMAGWGRTLDKRDHELHRPAEHHQQVEKSETSETEGLNH